MGKTLFTQAISQNIGVDQGKGVMFFSMEMSANELYERFVSGLSNVKADELRRAKFSNESLGRIHNAVTQIDRSNIYFTEEPTQSLGQIRAKARKHKNKHPDLSLIIIDYLGLMELDKADRHDIAVGKVTKGLKQLAKEIKVPVMLICQANRDLDKAKRPSMSNLKDSSSIEADADVIMFVHRQEVIEPETELKGVTEIIIAKDRHNNGNGTVYMEKLNGTFRELSAEAMGMLENREQERLNPPKETRGYKRNLQ
jgi:replicative DNA helicase